jgi:hypothetical protein
MSNNKLPVEKLIELADRGLLYLKMADGYVPANRNWVDYLFHRLLSTFPEMDQYAETATELMKGVK